MYCSSSGESKFYKFFVFVILLFLVAGVHGVTIEWKLLSANELRQSGKSNAYYAYNPNNSIDIEAPNGVQLEFSRYGLFNRANAPREINVYLSKRKREHCSEEHNEHKRHRHHSSECDSRHHSHEHKHKHKPDHSHENRHSHERNHHKLSSSELDKEHYKQAEVEAQMANAYDQAAEAERENAREHEELAEREHELGNEEAARKEEEMAEMYRAQADAAEKLSEAHKMEALQEAEMAQDEDGKHHKQGDDDEHHRHKDHSGDSHRNQQHQSSNHDDDNYDSNQSEGDNDERNSNQDDDYRPSKEDDEDTSVPVEHVENFDDYKASKEDDKDTDVPIEHVENFDDEFKDTNNRFEDDDEEKNHSGDGNDNNSEGEKHHKLDRRSPDLGSWLPSLSPTPQSTDLKTPTIPAVDTSVPQVNNDLTDASMTDVPSTSPIDETNPTAYANAETNIDDTSYTADTASPIPTTTTDSNSDSSSSWFSWFSSGDETPTYSPYTLLQYLSPQDTSPDSMMAMFSVFSDPSNNSYLSNASTILRIVMFFMPGTGIVDQVYFTMALSKIMWEAATMYYDGYGTVPIAVTVLYDLTSASMLSRRDESFISQTILTPGETVNIDGMDVPSFLQYIRSMEYPALASEQEQKLRKDIENLVTITYPNISDELETSFVDGLKDTMKFLALFNVKGDLKVENADVSFADVYTTMYSAFDTESIIEKIEKKISKVVDEITSHF